jgi:hypothetical protein
MRTLLLLLMSTSVALSQVEKCKYDVNEFDSFEGYRVVKTKDHLLGRTEKGNYPVHASVRKADSTYFLFISGISGNCVSNHDTEVSFKASDGKIYTLKHIGEVDCGRTVYVGAASATSVPVIYLCVTADEIRKHPITMIRITQGQSYSNLTLTLPMTLKQMFDCADNAPVPKKDVKK